MQRDLEIFYLIANMQSCNSQPVLRETERSNSEMTDSNLGPKTDHHNWFLFMVKLGGSTQNQTTTTSLHILHNPSHLSTLKRWCWLQILAFEIQASIRQFY